MDASAWECPRGDGVGVGLVRGIRLVGPFRILAGLVPSASPQPPSLPGTKQGIMSRGGAAQVAVWPAALIKVL